MVISLFTGPFLFVLASFIPVLYFLREVSYRWQQLKAYEHIAGPPASFLLGNLVDLIEPNGYGARHVEYLRLHEKYGDVIRLHGAWGKNTIVSVNTADSNLLKTNDAGRAGTRYFYPQSILGLTMGEMHSKQRKLLFNYFSHSVFDEQILPVVYDVTKTLVDGWNTRLTRKSTFLDLDAMKEDLLHWASQGNYGAMFGAEWFDFPYEEKKRVYESVNIIVSEIGYRTWESPLLHRTNVVRQITVKNAIRHLKKICDQMIQSRLKSSSYETITNKVRR